MDETLAKINMVKRSLCDNVRNANKHDGWGNKSHKANNDELEERSDDILCNGMKMPCKIL